LAKVGLARCAHSMADAPRIAEWLEGTAAEREAAFAAIEAAARSNTRQGGALDGEAVALVVACVEPIIASVLLAPASKLGRAEWTRASLLLFEMAKLDLLAVGAELLRRKDDQGVPLFLGTWSSETNLLAEILAKSPREWTREDAIAVALNHGTWHVILWVTGGTAVCAAAEMDEGTFFQMYSTRSPFIMDSPQPEDRYAPLALLCLEIVRSEIGTQPEGVIACAAMTVEQMAWFRPSVGKAVWNAGFLDVMQASLRLYNPIERIGKQDLIPSAVLAAFKVSTVAFRHRIYITPVRPRRTPADSLESVDRPQDVVEGAQSTGVDVIQPLLEKGAVDLAISTLTAYQMLGKPEDASVCAVWWGALFTLEILLASPGAKAIVAKLRSAGVDSVRHLLDNPLVQMSSMGLETGVSATKVAVMVWGRDVSELLS
jgi:hypothetical protein